MGKEQLKASAPDEENPEWTEEDFARAKPVEAFPELARLVRPGRPPMAAAERKQRVTMYLDQDVIAALKKDGRGWQTRANAALRKALGLAN